MIRFQVKNTKTLSTLNINITKLGTAFLLPHQIQTIQNHQFWRIKFDTDALARNLGGAWEEEEITKGICSMGMHHANEGEEGDTMHTTYTDQ